MQVTDLANSVQPGVERNGTLMHELDHALRACERAAQTLRVQRNSYTSACRLPDELLLEILLHVIDKHPRGQGSLSCIHPSHVCSKWRSVALHSPTLWSRINAHWPFHIDAVAMLLRRSRSAPLDINFSTGGILYDDGGYESSEPELRNAFSLLLAHMGRTQRLHIHLETLDFIPEMIACLSPKAAPLLHSINFDLGASASELFWPLFKRGQACFPALRRVHTMCTSLFHVTPLLLPNVTSLHIDASQEARYEQDEVSLTLFIAALRRMELLEELDLVLFVSQGLPEDIRAAPPIRLHRLKRLWLSGHMKDLLWLVDRIQAPPTARIRLHIHEGGSTDLSDAESVTTFASKLAALVGPMLLDRKLPKQASYAASFEMTTYEESFCSLTLWPRTADGKADIVSARFIEGRDQPNGALCIKLPTFFMNTIHVDSVFDALPLDSISAIKIYQFPSYSVFRLSRDTFLQPLLNCVKRMRSVESLFLSGWNGLWVKEFLANSIKNESPDRPPLFPKLRKLVLSYYHLGKPWTDDRSWGEDTTDDEDALKETIGRETVVRLSGAELLEDAMVVWRQKRGSLESIEFFRCEGMVMEDVAALKSRLVNRKD